MNKIFVIIFLFGLVSGCSNTTWREASREPAGIAADPTIQKNAVIEVYAADAFSWRGWFAVHTWIAVKPEDAAEYIVYEVVGWGVKRGLTALRVYKTAKPDRYWYGAKQIQVLSIQGVKASEVITKISDAVAGYL